jgi:hypothetical protein
MPEMAVVLLRQQYAGYVRRDTGNVPRGPWPTQYQQR